MANRVGSYHDLGGDEMSQIRNPLRYFGGKNKLATKIISQFPKHKIYVEPFGGGASVLFAKRPSLIEIYNDLDSEVHNVFAVLKDYHLSQHLEKQLTHTLYSPIEYDIAKSSTSDPVEQARRTIIKSFMAFGSAGIFHPNSGFRSGHVRAATNDKAPVNDFMNYKKHIESFTERLATVTVENKDFVEIIKRYDTKDTLFYVDPPYVHSTRSSGGYRHELTDERHIELLRACKTAAGKVVISAYESDLYDDELGDWVKYRFDAFTYDCNGKSLKREEILYIKPNSLDIGLFGEVSA